MYKNYPVFFFAHLYADEGSAWFPFWTVVRNAEISMEVEVSFPKTFMSTVLWRVGLDCNQVAFILVMFPNTYSNSSVNRHLEIFPWTFVCNRRALWIWLWEIPKNSEKNSPEKQPVSLSHRVELTEAYTPL